MGKIVKCQHILAVESHVSAPSGLISSTGSLHKLHCQCGLITYSPSSGWYADNDLCGVADGRKNFEPSGIVALANALMLSARAYVKLTVRFFKLLGKFEYPLPQY
jgi:hypothetical protein